MLFLAWLNNYVNPFVSNATAIVPRLNSLYNLQVFNDSDTSNVDISKAIHLYKNGKVCAHLIIENRSLWVAKSRIDKMSRYADAQTLNEVIQGNILNKSSVTGNSKCRCLDLNNVSDFVARVMNM